jgi:biotin transporter BioY
MSEGSRTSTSGMKIAGIVLLVVGVLWLLIALQMDVTAPNSRVVNIGRLQERSNQLLLGGLVTLIGAVLFGFGSLRAAQGNGAGSAAPQVSATPPCARDLSLEPYKVWLVARHAIVRNEVLGRFVCGDRLFETVDEALAHAHLLEMSAVQQQAAQAEAQAAAQKAATDAAIRAGAEAQKRRRDWLASNKAAIVGVGIVVLGGIGWAATSALLDWRATAAARSAAEADVVRLTAEKASVDAAAAAAVQAYRKVHDAARQALLDAELAKIEVTVQRGAYGLQYDARVRNGSRYHLAGLSGDLQLYAAGVPLPSQSNFSCCDSAEDANGFDLGYDIAPGGSARKEYAILSIEYQVDSPEMRKFVSDNRVPTLEGLAGNREIRLDARATFQGRAEFVQPPVREDLGSSTRYRAAPVDFDGMAAAQPDVAALQPAMDEALARAVAVDAALAEATARLNPPKP